MLPKTSVDRRIFFFDTPDFSQPVCDILRQRYRVLVEMQNITDIVSGWDPTTTEPTQAFAGEFRMYLPKWNFDFIVIGHYAGMGYKRLRIIPRELRSRCIILSLDPLGADDDARYREQEVTLFALRLERSDEDPLHINVFLAKLCRAEVDLEGHAVLQTA